MDNQPKAVPKTSWLATASLILPFTCIGAPLGLILGIAAIIHVVRSKGKLSGIGLASIGMVFSILAMLAIFPTVINQVRGVQIANCMNNLKQIGIAERMYADDHNSKFPPANTWNDVLKPYIKNPKALRCPKDRTREPSYAMNAQLSGLPVKDLEYPEFTVLFFDSIPGKNRAGGVELFPNPSRHISHGDELNIICYADGHAGRESSYSNWRPKPSQ